MIVAIVLVVVCVVGAIIGSLLGADTDGGIMAFGIAAVVIVGFAWAITYLEKFDTLLKDKNKEDKDNENEEK